MVTYSRKSSGETLPASKYPKKRVRRSLPLLPGLRTGPSHRISPSNCAFINDFCTVWLSPIGQSATMVGTAFCSTKHSRQEETFIGIDGAAKSNVKIASALV